MIWHLEALLIIIGRLAVWTLVQQLKHEVDHQNDADDRKHRVAKHDVAR